MKNSCISSEKPNMLGFCSSACSIADRETTTSAVGFNRH